MSNAYNVFMVGSILVIATLPFTAVLITEHLNKPEDPLKYYEITTVYQVHDSLKQKQAELTNQLVKSATQNLSTCDYEDVDKTINQAYKSAFNIYATEQLALKIKNKDNEYISVTITKENMSNEQKTIFEQLLKKM